VCCTVLTLAGMRLNKQGSRMVQDAGGGGGIPCAGDPQTYKPTNHPTSLMEQSSFREANKNSPHFMESEGSLPHSQAPATSPHPEPDQSSPFTHPTT
jgi:hypothetical protein